MTRYCTSKSGSAIITIVVILSVTLLIATSIQRITYYTRLSAIEREHYVYSRYLVRGLLHYGIAMTGKRPTVINDLINAPGVPKDMQLFAGIWPCHAAQRSTKEYKGIVILSYCATPQQYTITAQLYDHDNLISSQTIPLKDFK